MATQRPTRPPTFTWESDRDWTGQPFTAEDTHDSERQLAPDHDAGLVGELATPAPTAPEGPVDDQPGDLQDSEEVRELQVPGERRESKGRTPPVAVVLAEDVFAGLLDDPPPGAPWAAGGGPFDDEPTELVPPGDDGGVSDGAEGIAAPAMGDLGAAASELQAEPADVAGPGPTEVIPAEAAPTEVVDAGVGSTDVDAGAGAGLALTDPNGPALSGAGRGRGVARQVWSRVVHVAPGLGREDAVAAVAAGERAYLRALVDPRAEVRERAGAHAGQAAERSATRMVAVLSRGGRDLEPRGQASWERAGTVIPILGAGAGVGASVTAAAVFDALDAARIPTLLVDAAEPARSGLSRATGHPGNAADRRPHPDVGIAFAPRGGGWVAALSAPPDELLTDALVPDPSWWLPRRATPAVTVVDLGWDPWATATAPLRGAGVWLEAGDPPPQPLLVTTATRPGVHKARELLDRLRPWIERGVIAAPAGLVVTGARRWPRELRPIALRHLGALADSAVLLPRDRGLAVSGVGPDMVPARLRLPFAPLLRRWGLPVTAAPVPGRLLRGH